LPRHAQAGRNPELHTLFYKLAWLLNSTAVPVFVFDGAGRPSMKRGRHVRQAEHWLVEDFQKLINAFGFFSHQVCSN
jgi:Holliday junction resolvase YEN1